MGAPALAGMHAGVRRLIARSYPESLLRSSLLAPLLVAHWPSCLLLLLVRQPPRLPLLQYVQPARTTHGRTFAHFIILLAFDTHFFKRPKTGYTPSIWGIFYFNMGVVEQVWWKDNCRAIKKCHSKPPKIVHFFFNMVGYMC